MIKGTIFDIKRYAIHDGPGIRVTVFLKGCPLRCWWCHNPEGRDLTADATGNTPDKTNEAVMTPQEVMVEIEKDILYYDESGGGVTFSGGEPLIQHEFLQSILDLCKAKEIHTALDTCGYSSREVLSSVTDKLDLFLYDLKLIDETLHLKYTGASNRLILDNLRMLAEMSRNIVIRYPIIPQITDTEENFTQIANFVLSLKNIRNINLLPYHKLAHRKYKRLNLPNKMKDAHHPSPERLKSIKMRLEDCGFDVQIGG